MSLLIVDDSLVSREGMAELLQLRGWQVRTAASLVEALERMKQQVPLVVLLDIVFPERGEARGLIDAMQREPAWSEVKVVVTTGLKADEFSWWPQVHGVLFKPFTVEQVESTLASILPGVGPR